MQDNLYSPEKCPDWFWNQPSLLFSGYLGSFPGVKRSRHEVHQSPPLSAEVKNEWSCTSAPPIYLHGMDGDEFTLFFYQLLSI